MTDARGYSATLVEYRITRWLSLLSSISTIGRESVNLRVSKDYQEGQHFVNDPPLSSPVSSKGCGQVTDGPAGLR